MLAEAAEEKRKKNLTCLRSEKKGELKVCFLVGRKEKQKTTTEKQQKYGRLVLWAVSISSSPFQGCESSQLLSRRPASSSSSSGSGPAEKKNNVMGISDSVNCFPLSVAAAELR